MEKWVELLDAMLGSKDTVSSEKKMNIFV